MLFRLSFVNSWTASNIISSIGRSLGGCGGEEGRSCCVLGACKIFISNDCFHANGNFTRLCLEYRNIYAADIYAVQSSEETADTCDSRRNFFGNDEQTQALIKSRTFVSFRYIKRHTKGLVESFSLESFSSLKVSFGYVTNLRL